MSSNAFAISIFFVRLVCFVGVFGLALVVSLSTPIIKDVWLLEVRTPRQVLTFGAFGWATGNMTTTQFDYPIDGIVRSATGYDVGKITTYPFIFAPLAGGFAFFTIIASFFSGAIEAVIAIITLVLGVLGVSAGYLNLNRLRTRLAAQPATSVKADWGLGWWLYVAMGGLAILGALLSVLGLIILWYTGRSLTGPSRRVTLRYKNNSDREREPLNLKDYSMELEARPEEETRQLAGHIVPIQRYHTPYDSRASY